MGFDQTLKRLRDAARDDPLDNRCRAGRDSRVVSQRDLVALLQHFDRVDGEARMAFPPHRAQLAEVIGRLSPLLEELDHALHRMGPAR